MKKRQAIWSDIITSQETILMFVRNISFFQETLKSIDGPFDLLQICKKFLSILNANFLIIVNNKIPL